MRTPSAPVPRSSAALAARRALACVAMSVAVAGCAMEAEPPGVFIALTRDFADYESWPSIDRGVDPVPPSHEGRSVIYVDSARAPGDAAFEVGARIVRVQEIGDDPGAWEIHAMVKRGGGYNPDGAAEWEFFELANDAERGPLIVWRGEGPPTGDGYRPAAPGADVLGCNHCHASFPETDYVLSPALSLDR